MSFVLKYPGSIQRERKPNGDISASMDSEMPKEYGEEITTPSWSRQKGLDIHTSHSVFHSSIHPESVASPE